MVSKRIISNLIFTFLSIIVLLLSSCTEEVVVEKETTAKHGTLVENKYAEAFNIISYSNYTEIQVIEPITKEIVHRYGLGSDIPDELIRINKIPKRTVAMSATHIGMLEALNLVENIVGVSDKKYVCSHLLNQLISEGGVASMGDFGARDVEAFLAVQPDLIFFSGFDPKATILSKLKQAGITTFTNFDWKETHPLGRAEWIKVFGIIYGKEQEANAFFDNVVQEYDDLKEIIGNDVSLEKLLVGTPYGDEFNAPAGQSYMAKMLADAGANYLFKDKVGVASLSLTLEDVVMNYGDVPIWLNVNAKTIEEVLKLNPKFKLMNAVQSNRVYSYISTVNCFWEQSAINPHWVLHDLIKILHKDKIDTPFYFYEQLR